MPRLHEDSGKCSYCQKILDRYPGFHAGLRDWFEALQAAHPEAHISCAGRGQQDQEAAVLRKASKAHFGQSAHNYNAALDLFRNSATVDEMYDQKWFEQVITPALTEDLDWYGRKGAPYYERPHVEWVKWVELVRSGDLDLVQG